MMFEYFVTKPFDLANTVKSHGWFQLVPFYWDNSTNTLNWALNTSQNGPVAISIQEQESGSEQTKLLFKTHNNATADKDEIINQFHLVFNLDLNLSGFYKICSLHSTLKQLPQKGMGRLMRSPNVFQDVFKSICGTNVMWKQAVKMVNTIAELGDVVPGTSYRVFPTPQQILDASESYLKDTGRVGYRSAYLIELANRYMNENPETAYNHNTYPELFQFFVNHKGIGKVTARYLCALYGRFEELSIDSLVISYMTRTYFNGTKPETGQIEQIFEQYGEWKYLVYWMEFVLNKGWDPDA